jgi:hypothetical protein
MFTADGKRLLQEKHTGTVEEQLRSLTAETVLTELKVEQDKLGECIRLLTEGLKDNDRCTYCLRTRDVPPPVPLSKTYQHCLKLLKAYVDKNNEMQAKVTAHEDGFHLMTRNFFTDVNRLVINVPIQAQHKRAFIMPHEQDSRKKRKMPGPRRPEDKKGRRMRALKPQKVAAKQTRKKKPVLKPRWQDEPYRQPVVVKLEVPNVDPTRAFALPVVTGIKKEEEEEDNQMVLEEEEDWKAFDPVQPIRPATKRGPAISPNFDPTKMFSGPGSW